jgi:hypothetical protein
MEVLNLEAVAERGGGMRTLALFDLQLTPDVRMHGLRLMEAPDGNQFTYAAKCGQRRAATFARPLAEKITAAASLIYKAVTANGTYSEKV